MNALITCDNIVPITFRAVNNDHKVCCLQDFQLTCHFKVLDVEHLEDVVRLVLLGLLSSRLPVDLSLQDA